MKECTLCHQELPLSAFCKNSSKKDGLGNCCRPCHNDYIRERWRQLKMRAINHMGSHCKDCNGLFHRAAYEFHHLDPAQKEADWDKLKRRSWDRIIIELSKCVLLCANCHRVRHSLKE